MRRFQSPHNEAAQRIAERRRRASEAPRLHEEVPALESLSMHLEERREGTTVQESMHIRHFPLGAAPALFEFPCHAASCEDGGHDATGAIMEGLRRGQVRFEGDDRCQGRVGDGYCDRVLHYVATATYKKVE